MLMMSWNKQRNCIQSNIFHRSFSLQVNKFMMQYFRSLLCFAGLLRESEFLTVFSFSFPVIYQQIYCSIQTFNLVNYSLTSHLRGPGSHLKILGSRVPLKGSWVPSPTYGVPSPTQGFQVPGLGSHFSGMRNDNYLPFIRIFTVNNKQIFHASLCNIRNYSPEVIDIQQHEAELNIILPRVNNFDIKQIKVWNICFIICY